MKLSITLIFLACTSLLMAQSAKIDEDERARLENKFKVLKTFYINDDGLVVYNTQGEDSSNTNNDEESQLLPDTKESENIDNRSVVVNRYPQKTSSTEKKNEPYEVLSTNSKNVVSIDKRPINSASVTEVTKGSEVDDTKKTKVTPVEKTNINKKQAHNTQSTADNDNFDVEDTSSNSDKKTKKSSSNKKSVFSKAPLKYKDMEEAAMAVDELLEKLKKDQSQNGKTGSMSSRIARGAGKSTLRKQTLSEDEYFNENKTTRNRGVKPVTQSVLDQLPEENGEVYIAIPTYYINGQQVEKSVAEGLKKNQIIRKETRTRNTISGNPAGEVWIEIKDNYPN